jgi:hypothetical protein
VITKVIDSRKPDESRAMASESQREDERAVLREAFRVSQEKNAADYKDRRKKLEIEQLDGAQNMREYLDRRKALRSTIIQPEIPLDEASMSDYIKRRGRWR